MSIVPAKVETLKFSKQGQKEYFAVFSVKLCRKRQVRRNQKPIHPLAVAHDCNTIRTVAKKMFSVVDIAKRHSQKY